MGYPILTMTTVTKSKEQNNEDSKKSKKFETILIFLFFFCFSICAAILFQKVALPLIMNSPNGLVQGDSVYFNQVAIDLAEAIKAKGWGEWSLFPATGASGNVSILAALYVFFTPDISLVLPINAALHALSGLIIFLIATTIWPGKLGKYSGIVAASLFVAFPSALNWYAQIHKDGYVIAASLLILYAVVLSDIHGKTVSILKILGLIVTGTLLLVAIKPYHLRIMLVVYSILLGIQVCYALFKGELKHWGFLKYKGHLLTITIVGIGFALAPSGGAQDGLYKNWSPGVYVPYTELASDDGELESDGNGGVLALADDGAYFTDNGLTCDGLTEKDLLDRKKLSNCINGVCRTTIIFNGAIRTLYCINNECQTKSGRQFVKKTLVNAKGKTVAYYIPYIPDYVKNWAWQDSKILPSVIENQFKNLAQTRIGLIEYGYFIEANSLIDQKTAPNNIASLILFLPRALQIGLFAPFPSNWNSDLSLTRLIAVSETALFYFIFLGIFFGLKAKDIESSYSIIGFSLIILLIYGVTMSNLGTLYRLRYLPEMLFALLGVTGWTRFIQSKFFNNAKSNANTNKLEPSQKEQQAISQPLGNKALLKVGISLVAVTLLTYVALLVRDILIAREFGISSQLDAYTISALIPMFLVAVVSVPLGNAFVSQFINIEYKHSPHRAAEFTNQLAFVYILFATFILITYFILQSYLLQDILKVPSKILEDTSTMMSWMMVLFFLSGLVITGNSFFNAKGEYLIPSFGQFFVPIFAIMGVVLFSQDYGIKAVVFAMLLGQIANYIFIQYYLYLKGNIIVPKFPSDKRLIGQFIIQYFPLAIVAIFSNIIAFQSVAAASQMPEGSMAALGMSNKIIVLIAGLLDIVMTSIILPYFSRMFSAGHHELAQKRLSSLLLIGTVASIAFSFLVSVFAHDLIDLVFKGGVMDTKDVLFVAEIFRLCLIQIPFLVVNALLLKFAIANQQTKQMMFAILGVVILNILLTKHLGALFGVTGVTIAMAISVIFSSLALLGVFVRLRQIDVLDLTFILLNWMLFISMVVCIHYDSKSGIFSALLAFSILLYAEWKVILIGRSS